MTLSVALWAIMMTAAPIAAHETVLEHAGTSYRVNYEPLMTMKTRTIGHSVGTRQSTERCLWSIDVQVERQISATHAKPLVRTLADTHSINGSLPGNCRQNGTAIAAVQTAQQDKVGRHVALVASRDRAAAAADIDAARALALN